MGYGEAILLESPDPSKPDGVFTALIDGGSAENSEFADRSSGRVRIEEYLKKRGIKIGIATSCEPQMFLPALERNGILDLFESYTTVREVPRGKEFPDIYERQAEKMGLLPEECAVFEDILKAVQGANAGGFYTVGVYDAHSKDEWEEIQRHADSFIYSYKELIR